MVAEALLAAMHEARDALDAGAVDLRSRQSGARCIAFRVGDERYVIDLLAVREVITPPPVVPVPGAPEEVLGVMNLRGNVITVVNSRSVLGLAGEPRGAGARVLVIDDEGQCMGVLVDSVDDIVMVPGEVREGALMLGEDIAFRLERSALSARAPRG